MLQDSLNHWYALQKHAMARRGTFEILSRGELRKVRAAIYNIERLGKEVGKYREEVSIPS